MSCCSVPSMRFRLPTNSVCVVQIHEVSQDLHSSADILERRIQIPDLSGVCVVEPDLRGVQQGSEVCAQQQQANYCRLCLRLRKRNICTQTLHAKCAQLSCDASGKGRKPPKIHHIFSLVFCPSSGLEASVLFVGRHKPVIFSGVISGFFGSATSPIFFFIQQRPFAVLKPKQDEEAFPTYIRNGNIGVRASQSLYWCQKPTCGVGGMWCRQRINFFSANLQFH